MSKDDQYCYVSHAKVPPNQKENETEVEENPYKFLELTMRLITFSLSKKSLQKTMESSSHYFCNIFALHSI